MKLKYHYPHPMVGLTVDIILFADIDKVPCFLAIKRKNEPYKNKYAFPGGFVEPNEEITDAAYRELEEETSLTRDTIGADLQKLNPFTAPGRDPRGRTISFPHYGICIAPESAKAGDDAKSLKWVPMTPENRDKLAFDHSRMLVEAYSTLMIAVLKDSLPKNGFPTMLDFIK